MAGKQRLQIDEGEGQRGEMEDLTASTRLREGHDRRLLARHGAWALGRTWLVTTKAPNLITSLVSGGMPNSGRISKCN